MAFSNAGRHVMLNALAAVGVYVSLHTGDPGTTGASEVSGGTPAYARKAVTWNAASGGSIDDSNTQVFDVPGSTTVSHFGLWSAASAGTFYGGGALSSGETYVSQGVYTLDDLDLTIV